MMIHEITEKAGAHKRSRRVGRGESSGRGKTSGRGSKGATSRAGWNSRPAYEGGQTPFARKFPKRGFSNAGFRLDFHIINLKEIDAAVAAGETVDLATLVKKGLVPDDTRPLKVLAEGELSKKVKVVASRCSATAKAKIEKAGASIELLPIADRAAEWKAKRNSVKNAKGAAKKA